MNQNNFFAIAIISVAVVTLYACGGSEGKTPESSTISPELSASMDKGKEVFKRTCIACHQADGKGLPNSFPPLIKSDKLLADKTFAINQVIKGTKGGSVINGVKYSSVMPPQNLSDDEIVAVLNYVSNSWGNSGAAVTVDEVKVVREKAQ